MNVGASRGGGGVSGYSVDTANVQEVTFRTSGGLGEAETGGPLHEHRAEDRRQHLQGDRRRSSVSSSGLQSDNYNDSLRAVLSKPSTLLGLYDVDGALGGPIKKDKLWFFYLGRTYGNSTSVTGMFANKNAGNPNAWTYDAGPDAAGAQRRLDDRQRPAPHVADQPEEQAQSVRGLPEGLQRRRVDRHDAPRRAAQNPDGWIEGGTVDDRA